MNIRGLGGSTKRKYLSDWIRSEEVGMVCLRGQSALSLVRRVPTICGVLTKLIGLKSGPLILQEELSLCGEEIVSI